MQKPSAILGSALFFVVAPFTLAAVVPWWVTGWRFHPPVLGMGVTRLIGIALIAGGLPGLVDSFRRFAVQGLGTPAPIAPTQRLVVTGPYRHVRNPMYVAVSAIILGEWLLLGENRLLVYGIVFWLACHIFVVAYEEPTLARDFGTEYDAYRTAVPRWIPRLRPWRGG
jgi:protein-S-isoprenylcysteine O-methyltransferase Ste14